MSTAYTMTNYQRLPKGQRDETGVVQAMTGLGRKEAERYRRQVLRARGAPDPANASLQQFGVGPARTAVPEGGWPKPTGLDNTKDYGVKLFTGGEDAALAAARQGAKNMSIGSGVYEAAARRNSRSGRGFALPHASVAYAGKPSHAHEELSHPLNRAGDSTTGGDSDKGMASAMGASRLGLERSEAYYAAGDDNEVLNAMAQLKHGWIRMTGRAPGRLEKGEGFERFLRSLPSVVRDGYFGGDDEAPANGVLGFLDKATDALRSGGPGALSERERQAVRMLTDPNVWNQVADAERPGAKTETMADMKGGEGGEEAPPAPRAAEPQGAEPQGGPRIVVNPDVFHDSRDALCVAMNEAYRVLMESLEFDPASEPTDAQRRFFADTAYRDDETQLRRTILARVCTFDKSVKDPTDDQLHEAVEFLETVMEMGAPQNRWEQSVVQRTRDVLAASVGAPRAGAAAEPPPPAPEGGGTNEAAWAGVSVVTDGDGDFDEYSADVDPTTGRSAFSDAAGGGAKAAAIHANDRADVDEADFDQA